MGNYVSDKKNCRFFGLKLTYGTDQELIEKLKSVNNIQQYLKSLIRNDLKKESSMKIQFEAGTSRHGDYGVNYLISSAPSANVVLYAETRVPEGASDDYGYFALKAEILRQAASSGIPAESLSFWYDGQENCLESDASADCEVKGW